MYVEVTCNLKRTCLSAIVNSTVSFVPKAEYDQNLEICITASIVHLRVSINY